MKNLLLTTIVLLFFFGCNEETPKEGYFLQNGKIFRYNLSDSKAEPLEITDKEIVDFMLSPQKGYIAYSQLVYKSDCVEFTSAGVYDIAKRQTIGMLADDQYANHYLQGWKSETEFTYSVNISPDENDHGMDEEENISYLYTIGKGNVESEELWGDPSSEPSVAPLNKDYNTSNEEDGIHLLNVKTKEKTIISVEDENISYYYMAAWVNKYKLLFFVCYYSQAQCDIQREDLYSYDLKTGEKQLLFRGATKLQMIN